MYFNFDQTAEVFNLSGIEVFLGRNRDSNLLSQLLNPKINLKTLEALFKWNFTSNNLTGA